VVGAVGQADGVEFGGCPVAAFGMAAAERDEGGLDVLGGGQGGDEVEGLEDESDLLGAYPG
jgi:hypothetical protein